MSDATNALKWFIKNFLNGNFWSITYFISICVSGELIEHVDNNMLSELLTLTAQCIKCLPQYSIYVFTVETFDLFLISINGSLCRSQLTFLHLSVIYTVKLYSTLIVKACHTLSSINYKL